MRALIAALLSLASFDALAAAAKSCTAACRDADGRNRVANNACTSHSVQRGAKYAQICTKLRASAERASRAAAQKGCSCAPTTYPWKNPKPAPEPKTYPWTNPKPGPEPKTYPWKNPTPPKTSAADAAKGAASAAAIQGAADDAAASGQPVKCIRSCQAMHNLTRASEQMCNEAFASRKDANGVALCLERRRDIDAKRQQLQAQGCTCN